MSLLDDAMEKCKMLDKRTSNDGYGGYIEEYIPGAEFEAAIVYSTSTQTQIAQAEGVTAVYTVTTRRNVNLQFHDVFTRASDGKIFRVKTDGDDNKTPPTAVLNMRQVRAEEYILPD